MIETMEKSTSACLGYKLSGDVTKADYLTLNPAVAAAIKANGSVSLLFDMTDFKWEKPSAWGDDLDFGQQYQDSIDKMAIVGDKGWEKAAAKYAKKNFAKAAKYFESANDAWDWLQPS